MTNLDNILRSKDITLPTKVHLAKAMVFQWSCMDVRVRLWRKLSTKELMLLNCGVGEDSWESLGLQGDPCKGDQSWLFIGRTDVMKLKLWYFGHLMRRANSFEKPWCWERLRAGGEGDNRGWDGWMTSPTQWTGICINFGSWWQTGRPGSLQSMGSQRVGHDWATELNWTDEIKGWLVPSFVKLEIWIFFYSNIASSRGILQKLSENFIELLLLRTWHALV